MNVLRFRRDRRQRDPFDGTPLDRQPVTQAMPAAYVPHGIATRETLAALVEQAQAETAQARPAHSAAPWGPWDKQGNFPDALRADATDAGGWYGWDTTAMDVPPHHDRPYIPGVLGAGGRLTPRHAGIADDLGSLPLFRDAVRRIGRPACEQCQQATGTWQERLYATFIHHTRPVGEAGPRQFGIATELRQAHGETAADADDAEAAFTRRYLMGRAA